MFFRGAPFFNKLKPAQKKQYKNKLVGNVLVVLLVASLFPVLLVGSLTYFRSRDLLRNQTSRQMESLIEKEVELLKSFVQEREDLLAQMISDPIFSSDLTSLITADSQSEDFPQIRSRMFLQLRIYFDYRAGNLGTTTGFFDELAVVNNDGSLLVSTNDIWIGQELGVNKINKAFFLDRIGTNETTIFNDPQVMNTGHLVLVTTRTIVNAQGEVQATLLAIGTTPLFNRILSETGNFFPSANAFFFTPNKLTFGSGQNDRLEPVDYDPALMLHINPILHDRVNHIFIETKTQDQVDILAHARWLPEYQIGLSVLVPQEAVYGQIRILDSFNILVLVLSLALTGSLIYLGSTRLVTPLVRLARVAERFSKGNWDERAKIERDDEIGLLAHSFDAMANDLSALYRSMELIVERRTSQLRIASEVAQLASSTNQLSDILSRTVNLIAERFGFYHVAVHLVDETGRTLVLNEACGRMREALIKRSERVLVGPQTLIGWAAANNQSRVIKDLQVEDAYQTDALLPDTRSQAAIPISINQQVLGVLDIQSTMEDAFDNDTISVLQTLSNQISTTLHNTRLLETTQVNYQETSLLYRTTRLVTQARNENEIIHALSEALVQLPYVSAVMGVEGENLKLLVMADHKTGKVDQNLQNIHIPIRNTTALLLEQRVMVIDDITQPSGFDNLLSYLLRRGCKSAALLAIVEGGSVSKILALGARKSNQITHASLQPYANLTEVIGASLEKFRVLNTLQRRLGELQLLTSFSEAISAETDLNHLYRVLLDQVMQTMGTDINFAVALYDEAKNQIEIPFRYEDYEYKSDTIPPFPLGEGLTSYLIQNRKPLLINSDMEIISRQLSAKQVGKAAKSWMGIPLIFAGQMVGAIIIQDEEKEGRFTPDDVNLFMTLAPQIATAVRNAELLTETQNALHAYDQEHFLLNTMLSHSPDGITFKDVNGRYIRVSQSMADIMEVRHEQMEGKTDYDLFDNERASQIWTRQAAILDNRQPQTEIIEARKAGGSQSEWWQVTTIPIFEAENQPYGLLIVQRSISDVKRTEALAQRRAEQLLTAAEIARDTTGTLELETLLQKSVNLVRERFGFYHSSIFLIDPLGEYAILRESTGDAGEKMMQAGHRLAVGSKSIVGQVTAQGKALVVNNVSNDPTYYPNPLLPETRSELAIPLQVGERILGALDVQSTQAGAFNDEDVSILRILADQLAVAVVNGELFAKTQELLGKHRLLRQITTAASTSISLEETLLNVVRGLRESGICDRIAILMLNQDQQLQTQASAGYDGTAHLQARIAPGQGITGLVAIEKRPIRIDNTEIDPRYLAIDPAVRSELAIPILFSEELLGVLNLESIQTSAFDENDQEIMGALGSNLGGVIANIRLVQQVRLQVEREQLLFEITSKIRRSVDLETILETSTREICTALGARRARIQITSGSRAGLPGSAEHSMPSGKHVIGTGRNGYGANGRGFEIGGGNGHQNAGNANSSDLEQEADE